MQIIQTGLYVARVPAGRASIRFSRLSASGPRAALVIAHATSFMLPNDPARFHRTRQHSASFSSPPSPQPKCRPRSRLLHFHHSVFACALAAPFGEGVVAAPPRPRTPQWSASSVGVIRPGASRPGSDHASPLPVDCYCLGMASVLSIFACSRSSPLRSGSLLPSALPFTNARGTE